VTWIKICGTTNLDDARIAVDAGADALGFIFAPSPRRISPKSARNITSELPQEIEKVGVFVNQSPEIVLDTADTAGLTGIQLHGEEDEEYILDLITITRKRVPALDIFKVVSLRSGVDADPSGHFTHCTGKLRALVIDSGSASKRGGTGDPFDWPQARLLVRRIARNSKIVIAGGLRPNNVGEAIEVFQPWGVDVVSGVEREPGKKDPQKIQDFVAAVRQSAVAAGEKNR
jgi:phosphoribosylanthranilate isomerase